MNQNHFGSKISEYRQNKGLTQEELAGKIGVTPQALSKWERGHSLPDVTLIADLCRLLGCSADDLLGISGVKITENNDEKAQKEIWLNLRNCMEPLELTFGKGLVPLFTDDSCVGQVVQVRKNLSKEGILMPLVRVKDDLNLSSCEFAVLSYRNVLYSEILSGQKVTDSGYIMECLEKTVREQYADIINRDIVKEMVENLSKKYPALIFETVPAKISYGLLTNVLKKIMKEGKSCLYLVKIIEIMDDTLTRRGPSTPEELVSVLSEELKI